MPYFFETNEVFARLTALPPEFTTAEAVSLLADSYDAPEKVLETWTKRGLLIRLKRGCYVLRERYEPLAAAAAIGWPSYVSFETALAHYGLIPERAVSIISVIDGRPFEHVVNGLRYVYRSQRRSLFAKGMGSIRLNGRTILFASREKALLDALAYKHLTTKELHPEDVYRFVSESFRIEPEELSKLSLAKLRLLAPLYRNRAPLLFTRSIQAVKRRS